MKSIKVFLIYLQLVALIVMTGSANHFHACNQDDDPFIIGVAA
jgi:hypothetical protein